MLCSIAQKFTYYAYNNAQYLPIKLNYAQQLCLSYKKTDRHRTVSRPLELLSALLEYINPILLPKIYIYL